MQPPKSGTHSHQAFANLPVPIPFVAFWKLTASSRPSAPPSNSTKCLRFGHWLTLCTLNIHLLTYLFILSHLPLEWNQWTELNYRRERTRHAGWHQSCCTARPGLTTVSSVHCHTPAALKSNSQASENCWNDTRNRTITNSYRTSICRTHKMHWTDAGIRLNM